jgi:hypothetical protein
MEKSRVILVPESAEEKAKLAALWKILIDCQSETRKLVPIGEYVPEKNNNGATFHIEGLKTTDQPFVEIKVDRETDTYCKICNKVFKLKPGDVIPICCGKMVEVLD